MKLIKRSLALLLILCLCLSFASAEGITEIGHDHGTASTGIQEIGSPETETTVYETVDPTELTVENPTEAPAEQPSQAPTTQQTTTPAKPRTIEEIVAAAANDRLTWKLDGSTLWIGGKGSVKPFTSADDQPWASVREQIEIVRFEETAQLLIDDIAYWFADCINLTYADLPGFVFAIGEDAFAGCNALEELGFYHIIEAPEVADSAFSCTNGTDLTIITKDNAVATGLSRVNWSDRTADVLDLSQYDYSTFAGTCGISGCNCTSCSYYNKIDDMDEYYHYRYSFCTVCDAKAWASTYRQEHTFNSSGICTVCGYEGVAECDHSRTYNEWEGCTYYTYCYYCDEYLGSGTNHGTYTYGSWSYYSSSQHRRYYSCSDCGEGTYQYGSHSTTTQYSNYNDTQHSIVKYCSTCSSNVGSTTYDNHSYTYGSWSSYSSSQHRRTKGCSYCTLSTYDYGNHADSNGDGKCDTCSYSMSFTVTWDAGSNGGKVNGSNSVNTTVSNGSAATAPGYTPTKTGHSFTGWYTSSSGGSLYNTVTVTAARTFYAQFSASTYTITFDPGEGTTETTAKTVTYGSTYGDLPVPVRGGYNFDGWFTAAEGGDQISADTPVDITANQTLYAQWTRLVSFSVTVPANLPIVVDEAGSVHTASASIINNSTGDVKISSISLSAQNGWAIAPYSMNPARQKVDADQIGFRLLGADTTINGSIESLPVSNSWTVAEGGQLSLPYDAVVTALSQPVTDQNVLSIIFVLEWV